MNKKEVVIDGVVYVPKEESKTLQGEAKSPYKVGDWIYLLPEGDSDGRAVFRITAIDDDPTFPFDLDNGGAWGYNCRLATPSEIESCLRKICNEKYIGKKVKCLTLIADINKITNKPFPFEAYDSRKDKYWMVGDTERGVLVYDNGKWAEILPDLKRLPKSREEYISFLTGYKLSDENAVEFLDQYDFSE